jgi:hypothetical protein
MLKLTVISYVASGQIGSLPSPYNPFWSGFDAIGRPDAVRLTFLIVAWTCSVAIFCNQHMSLCSGLLGVTITLGMLSARATYQTNIFLVGCIFLVASLSEPGRPPWLVRIQCAIVYLGASLNKALDPDWQSGLMFDNWAKLLVQGSTPPYGAAWPAQGFLAVSAHLPPLFLAKLACWTPIAIELGLAVCCLVPRTYRVLVPLTVLFHFTLSLYAGWSFGTYLLAMPASRLAFVTWPLLRGVSVREDSRSLRALIRWGVRSETGPPELGSIDRASSAWLRVASAEGTLENLAALQFVLLRIPATYLFIALVLYLSAPRLPALQHPHPDLFRVVLVLCGLALVPFYRLRGPTRAFATLAEQ